MDTNTNKVENRLKVRNKLLLVVIRKQSICIANHEPDKLSSAEAFWFHKLVLFN